MRILLDDNGEEERPATDNWRAAGAEAAWAAFATGGVEGLDAFFQGVEEVKKQTLEDVASEQKKGGS